MSQPAPEVCLVPQPAVGVTDVTEEDEGEYTCSVEGQSDTFRVSLGKSGNTGQGSNDGKYDTYVHAHNNVHHP